MNAPIEIIKTVKQRMESSSNVLFFLALIQRFDLLDKWDLVISAEGLTPDKAGFEKVRSILQPLETEAGKRRIASIAVIDKNNEFLDGFRHIVADYPDNPGEFSDTTFGKYQIGHLYLFKSDCK